MPDRSPAAAPPAAAPLTLDNAQRAAADHRAGPLIVLAGPGSGKTRVIIARIERILSEGAAPESIVALTFTVKAAAQMRRRLADRVGHAIAERAFLGTFHSFGARILRRFGDQLALPAELTLADSAQRRRLMRHLISRHNAFPASAGLGRDAAADRCLCFIEACRQHARTPPDAAAYAERWRTRLDASPPADPDALAAERARLAEFTELAHMYARFEPACHAEGLITVDEYLTLPIRLLHESGHALADLRDRTRHVVVDEFQDVNGAQIELLRALCPPRPGNPARCDLTVVGDDDQAIYAFRGASQHAFRRFTEIWTDHTVIGLARNYRNAPPIQRTASAFIANTPDRFRPDKPLECATAATPQTPPVSAIITGSDTDHGIIAPMLRAERAAAPTRPWSCYAVIARTHTDLERIAADLQVADIPFAYTPGPVHNHPHVIDLFALLTLTSDPHASTHAVRLLARPPLNIDLADLSRLATRADRDAPDTPLTRFLLEDPAAPAHIREAAATLEAWLTDLRDLNLRTTPDQVAIRAIALTGAGALDPTPETESRAAASLAHAIRFIASRVPRLPTPADVGAFLAYYNDLDNSEQGMADLLDQRIGIPDDADNADPPDAVALLTAHAAKGLEFDTVFLPRVRPGHGYPSSRSSGDDLLPADFTGEDPPNRDAEERRLFYVAMTRAERRLILFAKARKARSKSTDYFDEIVFDAPRAPIISLDESEVREQLGAATPNPLDALLADRAAAKHSLAAIREARREVLAQIHGALHRLDSGLAATAHDEQHTIDTIALLGRRLAFLAAHAGADSAGHAGAPSPRPIPGDPDPAWAERIARAATTARSARHPALAPLTEPLDLSYTKIQAYLDCPLCFYAQHILRLPTAESEHLIIGNIAHKALELFCSRCRDAEAESLPTPTVDALLEEARRILRLRRLSPSLGAAFDHNRLDSMLRTAHDALHIPTRTPSRDILELERAFPTDFSIPGITIRHRIRGVIDRIDRTDSPSGPAYTIIDYKTGAPSKARLQPDPADLQLSLYAMAAASIFGATPLDPLPGHAEYWILTTGQRGSIPLASLKLAKTIETIRKAMEGMLAGEFPRGKTCRGTCGFFGLHTGD